MIGLAKLAPGPGNVGLSERPERAPGPGEVLIEVHAAGICGTDLHIEAGEFRARPPVTMGHEVCGVVTAGGDTVAASWLGAAVVSETYFSTCGRCPWCRDGRINLCPDRQSIGSMVDGAFAPRVIVPTRNLHRKPASLDAYTAVLIEPLACVCHCLCDPPVVNPGDRVLVTGPGPVGLLAAQVARALGGHVVVVGLAQDADRLSAARGLGFAAGEGDHDTAPESEVVIECSGSAGGAATCLEAAGRGARYVQVGVFGKPVQLRFDAVFQKELIVTSGFASTPQSWRRALALVDANKVDLPPLVSGVVPLSHWERSFADLRAGRGIKVAIDPRIDQ